MKGNFTRIILRAIENSAKSFADILRATASGDRSDAWHGKEAKKRYSSLLYKLKRDGLIAEQNDDGERIISITDKGIVKLHSLSDRSAWEGYEKEEGNEMIIFAFDIPERKRQARRWLRSVLSRLGYRMIQKSCWAGTVKIPEAFLREIRDRKIIDGIEIFSVQGGSLYDILNR